MEKGRVKTGKYFMMGNVACAEGAIAGGCEFAAGYPITPASEIGPLIEKYLKGVADIPTMKRIKMFRLVEKMVLESADTISDIHGGGSAAAHRITILRESDMDHRKRCASRLAGTEE